MPQPTEPSRPAPRRRLLRVSAATVALAGLAGYGLVQWETGTPGPPRCTVTDVHGERADGNYTLQPKQAANAAVIGAVGITRELPERAVTIAIATAMQESSLHNIDYGDRDSLGLFQQRPSMGWGSEQEIMDPVYSAGQFYDHLVEIPDYLDMPLTVAAQEVQRSAYPDEYAKHEPEATLLSAALSGREGAALTCDWGSTEPEPTETGMVVERLERDFDGTVAAHADGRSVGVPLPEGASQDRGWAVAHWAVAHAMDFGIERVVHDDQVWTASRADAGWRPVDSSARNGKGGSDDDGPPNGVQLRLATEE